VKLMSSLWKMAAHWNGAPGIHQFLSSMPFILSLGNGVARGGDGETER
jgi:hypothetical protein